MSHSLKIYCIDSIQFLPSIISSFIHSFSSTKIPQLKDICLDEIVCLTFMIHINKIDPKLTSVDLLSSSEGRSMMTCECYRHWKRIHVLVEFRLIELEVSQWS